MAKVRVKKGEKLDEETVGRVIKMLEEGMAKKDAYGVLNIAANPTRLNKIIEEFHENIAREKKMRAAKRGKPSTDFEIKSIIESYLQGESISEISKFLYRPASFIKNIIERVGVPSKPVGANYCNMSLLPEQCIVNSLEEGDLVWSSKYHAAAEVMKETGEKIYQIYVFQKVEEPSPYFPNIKTGGFYANQPVYELGSLKHLEKYGVKLV